MKGQHRSSLMHPRRCVDQLVVYLAGQQEPNDRTVGGDHLRGRLRATIIAMQSRLTYMVLHTRLILATSRDSR